MWRRDANVLMLWGFSVLGGGALAHVLGLGSPPSQLERCSMQIGQRLVKDEWFPVRRAKSHCSTALNPQWGVPMILQDATRENVSA